MVRQWRSQGIRFCQGLTPCRASIEEYETTIYAAGKPPVTLPGSASLSRNGRYALMKSSIWNTEGLCAAYVVDLQTLERTYYGNIGWSGLNQDHVIANDGTMALKQRLPISGGSAHSLINDAATVVVYQSGGGDFGSIHLSAYYLTTGRSVDLASDAAIAPVLVHRSRTMARPLHSCTDPVDRHT